MVLAATGDRLVTDAHYTQARFLGDVTVTVEGPMVSLSGARARRGPVLVRGLLQYTAAAAGAVGLVLRVPAAWWLLAAAALIFAVGYIVLWWTSVDETVTFERGAMSDLQPGMVLRPSDLMRYGYSLGYSLFRSGDSGRTVSFRAPVGSSDDRRVTYSLMAKTQADAVHLATLLGGDW